MAATLTHARSAALGRAPARSWSLAAVARLLRSRELALGLLAFIAVAAISGTMLPQRALTPPAEFQAWQAAYPRGAAVAEAIGLTHVYQSWWFLAMMGLLFLSLLACTVARAQQVWKLNRVRYQAGREIPQWVRMAGHHLAVPAPAGDDALGRAAAALTVMGYHCRREHAGAERVFAEKGRYGLWGSTALHLGLLVVIAGGVYSGAGKMAGYFELAEGQAFFERAGAFQQVDSGPLYRPPQQGIQMRLDELQTAYWENGMLREIASVVTLDDRAGELRQENVSVDRPLMAAGATVYQAKRHGFAALLSLTDGRGTGATAGYVNFPTPAELTHPATNRFQLPGAALKAEADFYPAPDQGAAQAAAWSQARPERAWMYLFVRDEQAKVVFQGPLALGETVQVGPYGLTFTRVARWAGFPVVRDPGLPVIFAGFALGILGAALTFVWIPKRVWAWVEETEGGERVLCLGGRADKFPAAFAEEIEELAAGMRGRYEPA